MPQVARPEADVANTGWGPTPLFPHVNTVNPNDGSPVACPVPPGGSFDVQLRPLAWPGAGPQTLTVRLDENVPGPVLVTFLLLQITPGATTAVTGLSVEPTGTLTNYALALTPAEIALISDYTNLRVRVLAASDGTGSGYGSGIGSRIGGTVTTTCCPGGLPTTLRVTPSNQSGTCGLTAFTMTWDGLSEWTGADNNGLLWHLRCFPGGSGCGQMLLSTDSYGSITAFPDAGCTCNPVSLVYSNLTLGGSACSGMVTLAVTP